MRYLSVAAALLLSYAPPILATYRFICNGILADGTERADSCGVCDASHAARWSNPNIPVLVDYEKTPVGISASEWRTVVKQSFAAWEDISGSNLRFVPVQGKSRRDFGTNEAFHEIFWITDKEEWRRLVGTGEFGTLGATLPRYTCDENREIVDSDMALNGIEHINWQINCDNEFCISPQTTLVHELGHFFGLDHPCMQCTNSIMSARAGLDLKYPLFDDMEGLRVLYPDSSSGLFGYPCINNADCRDSLSCLSDKDNKYCSHTCAKDSDCELGSVCQVRNGQYLCAFIDGLSAGAKSEGENCSRVPCDDSLICAGPSLNKSFCFRPCQNDTCQPGQECITLRNESVSICITIKQKGDRCYDTQLCDEHLFCVFNNSDQGICREACGVVNADTTGCPEGEVCELFEKTREICVPVGGELALDSNSAGFGYERGFGSLERKAKPAAKSGCSTENEQKDNNITGLILCLLVLYWRNRVHSRIRRSAS